MKQSQSVNYFRIRHRNTNGVFIRWYGFDQILGSNDGENFTLIASNIVIPDATNGPQQRISKHSDTQIQLQVSEILC